MWLPWRDWGWSVIASLGKISYAYSDLGHNTHGNETLNPVKTLERQAYADK